MTNPVERILKKSTRLPLETLLWNMISVQSGGERRWLFKNTFCISMNARLFFQRVKTLLVNLGTPRGVRSAERGRKEGSKSTTSRNSGGVLEWSTPVSRASRKADSTKITFPTMNGIKGKQCKNTSCRIDEIQFNCYCICYRYRMQKNASNQKFIVSNGITVI